MDLSLSFGIDMPIFTSSQESRTKDNMTMMIAMLRDERK